MKPRVSQRQKQHEHLNEGHEDLGNELIYGIERLLVDAENADESKADRDDLQVQLDIFDHAPVPR